ncbi:hypothetical protein V8D89_015555 [Ganoderma adspersum]
MLERRRRRVKGGKPVGSTTIECTKRFTWKAYSTSKHLITICNGASVVAMAGVLDGRRATTSKVVWKTATAVGPKVDWVKMARYIVDGNCWTPTGIGAGMDVTLAWIARVYGESGRVEFDVPVSLLESESESKN